MKKYQITMYAPNVDKFHFTVTAESKEMAERIAYRRVILISIKEEKEDE